MKTYVLPIVILCIAFAIGFFVFFTKQSSLLPPPVTVSNPATNGEKTTLTYAVHWTEKFQTDGVYEGDVLKHKGLKQYLEEYTTLHPEIAFTIQVIPYNEYAQKLAILYESGLAPDIYQIYSPWGVSYVQKKMLSTPPQDIINDVQQNYISYAGATIAGNVWGIPTEINDYALLYNKNIFKKAGLVDSAGDIKYPKTWNELVQTAKSLTQTNSDGTVKQYGIAFLKGNDWQVVDPFLSLLFSNGGKFLSDDLKRSMFNSPEGIAALESQLQLFRQGSTDINANFFDFKDGKVAMVISPPWTKESFKTGFGEAFATSVGVAPVPFLQKPATLQYSWFVGVMKNSAHEKAAWDFLKWFTSEIQPESGTTRYGDLLSYTIGAIPSRTVDFENHPDVLGDFFTKTFVDQMKFSQAEPNAPESSRIKSILMREIEAAWADKKTAKEALDAAAKEIDTILTYY